MLNEPNRSDSRLPQFAGRLLAEMLVVFVGVYAAFSLDSMRSERQDAQRVNKILVALQTDFAESQETLSQALPLATGAIDSLISQHDAGEMPEIGHLALELSFRSRAWEAMLESGGVNVLDVDFILAVEDYYMRVERLQDRTEEARRMSVALVLPQLDSGNAAFYDPETRRLKRSFAWYMDMLRQFRGLIVDLEQKNKTILEQINQMLDS